MKKILLMILLLSVSIVMVSCSNTTTSQELETPKAELQTEQKSENNTVDQKKDATQKEQSNQLSVKNSDQVFEFIKSAYPQYTKDDFSQWTATYFDVTGDGINEVIFTAVYGDGSLESAMIITVEKDTYREISRYMPLAKYDNKMEMKDGFLVHTAKTGGTGVSEQYMDLYVYGGYLLEVVRQRIKLEETVAAPSESYAITSKIEGNLNDFVITYTKKDLATDKKQVIAKDKYQYIGDNYDMKKTPVSLSNTAKAFDSIYTGNNLIDAVQYFYKNQYHFEENKRIAFAKKLFDVLQKDKIELSEIGYSVGLPDENLNDKTLEYTITTLSDYAKEKLVKIKNSGMYQLVKTFYATEGVIDEMGFAVMINSWAYQMLQPAFEIIQHEEAYSEFPFLKPDIYFSADSRSTKIVTDTHIVYPNVLVNTYEDVMALKDKNTWKTTISLPIAFIGDESLSPDPSSLAGNILKDKPMQPEKINGENIDYNQYTAVIVPMYSGINFGEWAPLGQEKVHLMENAKTELNFAIFGTMEDITITNIPDVGETGASKHLDLITNSKVRIFCDLPSDMSHVRVTGSIMVGAELKKVEFTLDDMRSLSDYKIIKYVKGDT